MAGRFCFVFCYHEAPCLERRVAFLSLEQAYPSLAFRSRSRNWWARLTRVPAECVHLENDPSWAATFMPDTLYLRGKASVLKSPARPEVSLCRECFAGVFEDELAAYSGRVVAFEPDAEHFTQYFFVENADFDAAGLRPEVSAAIARRLEQDGTMRETGCEIQSGNCSAAASWLWLPREEVPSLDDTERIAAAPGQRLCAKHGARTLCRALAAFADVNLFYVNAPYGEAGAYLWI